MGCPVTEHPIGNHSRKVVAAIAAVESAATQAAPLKSACRIRMGRGHRVRAFLRAPCCRGRRGNRASPGIRRGIPGAACSSAQKQNPSSMSVYLGMTHLLGLCSLTVELSCGPATPVRTNNRHCTGLTESAAQGRPVSCSECRDAIRYRVGVSSTSSMTISPAQILVIPKVVRAAL